MVATRDIGEKTQLNELLRPFDAPTSQMLPCAAPKRANLD